MGVALTDQKTRYRAALDYLFDRTTGKSKLGLERTAAFLRELGDPHERLRSFHIAGTNGKGSVCATLDTVLRTSGTLHGGKTLLYRASKRDCEVCSLKIRCCPKEPSRKIPRDVHEDARDVARFGG